MISMSEDILLENLFFDVVGSRWTNEKHKYRMDETKKCQPSGSPDSPAQLSLHW